MWLVQHEAEPFVVRRPAGCHVDCAGATSVATAVAASLALLAFLLHLFIQVVVCSCVVILAAFVALDGNLAASAWDARRAVMVAAAAVADDRGRGRVRSTASASTAWCAATWPSPSASSTVDGEYGAARVAARVVLLDFAVRADLIEEFAQVAPVADVRRRDARELVHVRELGHALDHLEHLLVEVLLLDVVATREGLQVLVGPFDQGDERHDLAQGVGVANFGQQFAPHVARCGLEVAPDVLPECEVSKLEVAAVFGHDAAEFRDWPGGFVQDAPCFLAVDFEGILVLDAERLHLAVVWVELFLFDIGRDLGVGVRHLVVQ